MEEHHDRGSNMITGGAREREHNDRGSNMMIGGERERV